MKDRIKKIIIRLLIILAVCLSLFLIGCFVNYTGIGGFEKPNSIFGLIIIGLGGLPMIAIIGIGIGSFVIDVLLPFLKWIIGLEKK